MANEISTTGVEALKNLMQRHVDKARLKRLHTTLCQNCAWHQHTSQAWGISESAGPQLSVSAHDFLEKFAGPMVQNDGRPIHSTAAMEKGGWAVASPPRSLACTVRFSDPTLASTNDLFEQWKLSLAERMWSQLAICTDTSLRHEYIRLNLSHKRNSSRLGRHPKKMNWPRLLRQSAKSVESPLVLVFGWCLPCQEGWEEWLQVKGFLGSVARSRGATRLYKGGNRLQGSCNDLKHGTTQIVIYAIYAIYAHAFLALPFFGCCLVRTPCIREKMAYREAAMISKASCIGPPH